MTETVPQGPPPGHRQQLDLRGLLLAGLQTPVYLYDLARVRANADRLRAVLPQPSRLYYSLKANSHPALLVELRRRGCLPEVCSPGELAAALASGWSAGDVLYTGPAKRDEDVADALARGVRLFSVDSPAGLDQADRLAAAADAAVRCILRVNDEQPVPGQGLAMTGVSSQFGADLRWILAEPERFGSRPHASVVGLHLYMGTNLVGVDSLLAQFTQSLDTAARVRERLAPYGVELRLLDLGGGFGAPFATHGDVPELGAALAAGLTAHLARTWPDWRRGAPELAFESGRYLVATCGTLVARVLEVKESQGRHVAVLESGVNHLGGMSGLRRLPPLAPQLVTDAQGREVRPTLVAGPLCTPLDTWARGALLPELRAGDVVAVPNVGAYGLSASLVAFLGHPLPTEAVLDSDDPSRPPEVTRLGLVRAPAAISTT
jgi:diaminopimelate decarboxylase